MKKIVIAAILSAALWSCYEDKSTYATDTIDDVVLTLTEGQNTIYAGYLEELDIVPVLTKGGKPLDDESFTYCWEMNYTPNGMEFEVIGTERELHTLLTNAISTRNYLLKLTVCDETEGLEYLFTWNVYIQTAFLDGLVVCDTRDGQTSDLSLILNNRLTMNYTKDEVIYRNIVEASTGAHYPSLLGSLYPNTQGYIYSSRHFLWAIDSDGKLVRFDCENYSSAGGDDMMVYSDGQKVSDVFSTTSNAAVTSYRIALTNQGHYAGDGTNATDFITGPNANLGSSNPKDGVFAFAPYSQDCSICWIEESSGAVKVFAPYFQGAVWGYDLEEVEGSAYPAGDLGVQQVLAAGMTGADNIPAFLVKDADGDYAIYTVAIGVNSYYDEEWDYWWEETYYRPGNAIKIPAAVASRIASATDLDFTNENSILYITSDNQISAVLFGNGSITDGGVKFTPDAGETITSVKVYRQGNYYYSFDVFNYVEEYNRPKLDLTSRALIVTTQKGDEGFVYVVPMTQLGTGNLDRSKEMKFDGFGRILDVATTGY